MAYTKSPRPYKREWELEQKRNEKKARAARARLRRKVDANGVDKNGNGKADKREGKDIAHLPSVKKGYLSDLSIHLSFILNTLQATVPISTSIGTIVNGDVCFTVSSSHSISKSI